MLSICVLLVFLVLFFFCFFKLIVTAIHLSTALVKGKSSQEHKPYTKDVERHQKTLLYYTVDILLISSCLTFFAKTNITLQLLLNIFLAYLTVNFIIFMHELGHYYFGKKFGLDIESFTVGMGHELLSVKRKETIFVLRLIPFLGFVKPRSSEQFEGLKGRQKILFASGGIMANVLLYLIGFVFLATEQGHTFIYGLKMSMIFIVTSISTLIHSFNWDIVYSPNASFDGQVESMLHLSSLFSEFWIAFVIINFILVITNLIPIHPLDGSRIFHEFLVKIMNVLHIPKKVISFITGGLILIGLIFLGSRSIINNIWDMYNDLSGRWGEFTLWFLLLFTVIGYFTQRSLDKLSSK
jgi:membrane-associated protease RseP (regulator of RpoE activity)